MSRVSIEPARPEDDQELRRLASDIPMAGPISVAFLREPNYFVGTRPQGRDVQVHVGRDSESGLAVGVGVRALKPAYVNGELTEVGYLSDLRLDARYRGGLVIARSYRYLRELHSDGRVRLYFTVIVEGNTAAQASIAAGRADLPAYHDMGRLVTRSVPVMYRRKGSAGGLKIERGNASLAPAIIDALNRHARTRQFGPHHVVEDLHTSGGRLVGLSASDFYVAMQGGEIVGTVAAWDQRSYRQTVVVGYGGMVAWLRPVINGLGKLAGMTPYPEVGRPLHSFHAAFLTAREDDPSIASQLLTALASDAVGRGYHSFLVGLHERDPLTPAVEGFFAVPFRARIYAVCFPADEDAFRALDGRVPHLEAALL